MDVQLTSRIRFGLRQGGKRVGLGLSVTMIMLPVGLAVGLLGFAMFVGGMTVRMGRTS